MQQPGLPLFHDAVTPTGTCDAQAVARGVSRLLLDMGYSPLVEFKLGNGRRVDVAGLNRRGIMTTVEIKTSLTDLRIDGKWPEYLPYCDHFYFAVPPGFPEHILEHDSYMPERTGIIRADRYAGTILRAAAHHPMNSARRRTETLRFARKAARRLAALAEEVS